jgi:hypothetical protein
LDGCGINAVFRYKAFRDFFFVLQIKGFKTIFTSSYRCEVKSLVESHIPWLDLSRVAPLDLYFDFGITISLKDTEQKVVLAWFKPALEKLWELLDFRKVQPDNLAGFYDLGGYHGPTKKKLAVRGVV